MLSAIDIVVLVAVGVGNHWWQHQPVAVNVGTSTDGWCSSFEDDGNDVWNGSLCERCREVTGECKRHRKGLGVGCMVGVGTCEYMSLLEDSKAISENKRIG